MRLEAAPVDFVEGLHLYGGDEGDTIANRTSVVVGSRVKIRRATISSKRTGVYRVDKRAPPVGTRLATVKNASTQGDCIDVVVLMALKAVLCFVVEAKVPGLLSSTSLQS
jgi:hypothetical protein